MLVIQDFQSEDLNREYNCSVRNDQGNATRRAQLQEEGESGNLVPSQLLFDLFNPSSEATHFF